MILVLFTLTLVVFALAFLVVWLILRLSSLEAQIKAMQNSHDELSKFSLNWLRSHE